MGEKKFFRGSDVVAARRRNSKFLFFQCLEHSHDRFFKSEVQRFDPESAELKTLSLPNFADLNQLVVEDECEEEK